MIVTWCRIEITPMLLAKWDIPIVDNGTMLDPSARGLSFESYDDVTPM
jgi:hypothetical protein